MGAVRVAILKLALVSGSLPRLPVFRPVMICIELKSMISGTLAKKVSHICSA